MVQTHGPYIQIATTDFIKQSKVFYEFSIVFRNDFCETFSEKSVEPEFCGEKVIVFFRVSGRLTFPKLMSQYSVNVYATTQRLKFYVVSQINAPGDIVLLQCRRNFTTVALIFGNISEQYLCFPLSVTVFPHAIIPADTHRDGTHIACIL